MGAKIFIATLEPDKTRLRWVIARVPFDVAKTWPERRGMRVRGEISAVKDASPGFRFRTSLFPDPRGKGSVLLVNKAMQAAANAYVGARVRISLEPDLEERVAVIPPELKVALSEDRRLRKWFDGFSQSHRKEIGKWVSEPKSAERRAARAEQMAERLLLALEGEIELPPILRAAFEQEPLALRGWKAMTLVQRRGHLMGIFYYRTVESRERRAAKAVAEALRVARRCIDK